MIDMTSTHDYGACKNVEIIHNYQQQNMINIYSVLNHSASDYESLKKKRHEHVDLCHDKCFNRLYRRLSWSRRLCLYCVLWPRTHY